MSLLEALNKRGYNFRLHREEEGWGWFEPTVVDLPRPFADALKYGGIEGLRAELAKRLYSPPSGLWVFPSLEIEAPVPRRSGLTLFDGTESCTTVVVPGGDTVLKAIADDWVAAVQQRFGVTLPVVEEDSVSFDVLATRDLVVFGGAHENRLALELAMRRRNLFVDATVPGKGGWVVTTLCGMHPSDKWVVQVTSGVQNRAETLALLLEKTNPHGGELRLDYVHHIQQGPEMAAHFPSWEKVVADLPSRIRQFEGQKITAPEEPEALADLLARGLDSGGIEKSIYNVAPVDIANDAARYYQLSGDRRGLQLFRALLIRLTDYYLKTPGGACYPADLDFRLGLLIMNFSRFEHDPIFDDDDRIILVNLLLSCARSIHEYASTKWPVKRSIGSSRHNHQTFPALSLLFAADYFSRFNLPYLNEWRRYTEEIFSGALWRRSKQCENAASYEPFVFAHAAVFSMFNGRGLSLFAPGVFRDMVERQIATTDNFFRTVDYGDTAVTFNPCDSVTARMLALSENGLIRWFAAEGFKRDLKYLHSSVHDFPGIRLESGFDSAPTPGDWERVPVEPQFLDEVAPGFPENLAYDKLAFRTGWEEDDQYLLIEGVTGKISHSHWEVNGIVRMNHLGRHWIVSNGYGRRVGVTHVTKSFSTRELGPPDHNMLVLQRDGKPSKELGMNAELQRGCSGGLLWFTGAQLDYAGVDWFRTVIISAGRYVLVLDRLNITKSGLEKGHVEWNCLGAVQKTETGFRLEQDGVFLEVASPSNWQAEVLPADQGAEWKQILENKVYPHATFPLPKLVFNMPSVEAGQTLALATFMAADRGKSAWKVSMSEPGSIVITGPQGEETQELTDKDIKISVNPESCRIDYAPLPLVPPELVNWKKAIPL